tara:strand:- start:47421 stop:47894 length:474 start_codon:yes stop_codon:yes gene_type:complete
MSGLFGPEADGAVYFSRFDEDELLGSFVSLGFDLEQIHWPTVEHYFQAMQFESSSEQERIRLLATPKLAHQEQSGRWFKRRRKDWKTLRTVYLTRAIYTRCKTHEAANARLLGTGDVLLIENDQYDYFWGCGRDRRGENQFGRVLMDVREKLRSEAS